MSKQTIGEFLATLRKANGYTQQEVADRLGISNRTLSGWECNNVLPDILLLPALAELYGVTVDEILAGERMERNDVTLTGKSEKKILKNKIAHFSVQCCILIGIIIAGFALVAACAVIEATKVSVVDFPWWRLLLLGLVPIIVCFAILFAFWKGAELYADDASDEYCLYCLVLRRKLANCLFVLAAVATLVTIFSAIGLFVTLFKKDTVSFGGVVGCIVLGIVAVTYFAIGWVFYKNALVKWGGEKTRYSIVKDRQYFGAVGFWGAIPLVLSVILATVLGCVHFDESTVIYQNADVHEFVKHMETFEGLDKEYDFPFSEIAKTARAGDEFDLGDGYIAVYNVRSFTIRNEKIIILDGTDTELKMVTYSLEIPRVFIFDGDESLSFYNARYWYYTQCAFGIDIISNVVYYGEYYFEKVGDGLAFVHNVTHDYSSIGYAVSFAVIAADLIVCATLCVFKRNRYAVKF